MLGWFNASDMDKRVGRVARANRRPLTDEDTRQILAANRVDAMLYAAASTMFKLDWLVFWDAMGVRLCCCPLLPLLPEHRPSVAPCRRVEEELPRRIAA